MSRGFGAANPALFSASTNPRAVHAADAPRLSDSASTDELDRGADKDGLAGGGEAPAEQPATNKVADTRAITKPHNHLGLERLVRSPVIVSVCA
ncbi:hypothetical protein ACQ86B_09595 [Mycolicibacterium aichiense]|uniref:hypothetical protein n=1 Tax=Mycolicibacterium aichiense TaxID=1799 RepID=UPI003D67F08C